MIDREKQIKLEKQISESRKEIRADRLQLNQEMKIMLEALAGSLKGVYGSKLKAVILYGSVARGTATPESDIDLIVLVDADTKELKRYENDLCDVSADYALEYLKVFSIIDICYTEFQEWKHVLPFYRNIDTEGVVIYAA